MERKKHLMTQIVLTIIILFVYFIEFSREQNKIIESLKRLSPLFLEIIFVIFIILLIINFKDILALFKALGRKHWLGVCLIVVWAFILAFFLAPRTHRIYYDENIYLHIGQSIAYAKKAQMINFGEIKYGELFVNQGEYNKQPNAYPYLLSIFYRLFGCSENVSFLINNLIFSFSCLIIFLIGFLLFNEFKIGIYGALVFSILPQNILWHNTTSVEPSNTLFICLTVLLILSFLKSKRLNLLFLAGVSACFTAQFRMESILIFPLFILILLIDNPRIFREQKVYYLVPLILVLMLPHFLHIYCFQSNPWGATGQDKYSLSLFNHNLKTNGLFFLNNKDFPALLTLFLFLAFFSKIYISGKVQILIWLLFFWGGFLFFYAGSYYYGADIRFVLMAFPPFSILAALGLFNFDQFIQKYLKRKNILALAFIVIAFLAFAPKARTVGQEAWAARADHYYAKIMLKHLPPDSIIFTHNPNMFLFWGRSSAQASILAGYDENGLKNLKIIFPGGIYFHYNFWCNVSDPVQQNFCKSILDKFPHQEVLKFQERDYAYVLYKIEYCQ